MTKTNTQRWIRLPVIKPCGIWHLTKVIKVLQLCNLIDSLESPNSIGGCIKVDAVKGANLVRDNNSSLGQGWSVYKLF